MRHGRFLFTIRTLMIAVAIAALACSGYRAWRYQEGHQRKTLLFRTARNGACVLWFDMRKPAMAARCRQFEAVLKAQAISYRIEFRANEISLSELPPGTRPPA